MCRGRFERVQGLVVRVVAVGVIACAALSVHVTKAALPVRLSAKRALVVSAPCHDLAVLRQRDRVHATTVEGHDAVAVLFPRVQLRDGGGQLGVLLLGAETEIATHVAGAKHVDGEDLGRRLVDGGEHGGVGRRVLEVREGCAGVRREGSCRVDALCGRLGGLRGGFRGWLRSWLRGGLLGLLGRFDIGNGGIEVFDIDSFGPFGRGGLGLGISGLALLAGSCRRAIDDRRRCRLCRGTAA